MPHWSLLSAAAMLSLLSRHQLGEAPTLSHKSRFKSILAKMLQVKSVLCLHKPLFTQPSSFSYSLKPNVDKHGEFFIYSLALPDQAALGPLSARVVATGVVGGFGNHRQHCFDCRQDDLRTDICQCRIFQPQLSNGIPSHCYCDHYCERLSRIPSRFHASVWSTRFKLFCSSNSCCNQLHSNGVDHCHSHPVYLADLADDGIGRSLSASLLDRWSLLLRGRQHFNCLP